MMAMVLPEGLRKASLGWSVVIKQFTYSVRFIFIVGVVGSTFFLRIVILS